MNYHCKINIFRLLGQHKNTKINMPEMQFQE